MARTVKTSTPDEMVGLFGFLEAEGTYHMSVDAAQDGIKLRDEKGFDGFSVRFRVAHGAEEGKTIVVDFLDGKESHKDGGTACDAKQTAYLLATNLISPVQCNGSTLEIEIENSIGAQVVAEFRLGKEADNGKRYLELHYSNIYHIDDPRGAKASRNVALIEAIPAAFRHKPEAFDAFQKKKAPASTSKPAADLDLGGI